MLAMYTGTQLNPILLFRLMHGSKQLKQDTLTQSTTPACKFVANQFQTLITETREATDSSENA